VAGFVFRSTVLLKPTISFNDQLEKLKSRKLGIDNRQEALQYLKDNSYYHLNIYFKYFQKETGFIGKNGEEEYEFVEGTTFDDIVKIHEHDKLLRTMYLGAIQPIELRLRAVIAYCIGIEKGSDAFYLENDNNLYYDKHALGKLQSRFDEIVYSSSANPIVQHHNVKYAGKFPLFAIFELCSLSFLIDYFNILSYSFQDKIANKFFYQKNNLNLKNWMKCINELRNICAH